MSPKTETLKTTAYHEAGHAVAAWRNKIPLGQGKHALSIIPTKTTLGDFLYKNILKGRSLEVSTTDSDRLKMERTVVAKLAGLVAQRRYKPSSVRSWHGTSDFHSAIDLVSRFAESNQEIEVYLKLLRIRAEQVLARPGSWECVDALAAALVERKALSGTEAVEIIRATHARIVEDRYKSKGFSLPVG